MKFYILKYKLGNVVCAATLLRMYSSKVQIMFQGQCADAPGYQSAYFSYDGMNIDYRI